MRYQKNHRITLFESKASQDSIGSFHTTYRKIGSYWAHYRPVAITKEQGAAAVHEIADAIFTLNKPSWFDSDPILTDLHCVWKGRAYEVTRVEDIDGLTRGDIRLFMRQMKHQDATAFLNKVEA